MRAVVEELAAAAERGVDIALVLPDHPNVGRAVTDETIDWLCQHAPRAIAANRLHIYTLATCSPTSDGGMRYRPVYVHAKVAVIDDRWAAVGSANLNSRGMSHDAELNVAIEHMAFARGLRQTLWAEHTATPLPENIAWPVGPTGDDQQAAEAPGAVLTTRALALVRAMPGVHDTAQAAGGTVQPVRDINLSDPIIGLQQLARMADENLRHVRQGEPLVGHLLPYLRSSEDATSGLRIERHRGLLDPLREIHEGIVVPHYNRYI
jgi:phospholipase D-like protein